MKVLVAHNFYQQPGGEDNVARQEVGLLQSRGNEVLFYTRHNENIRNTLHKVATAALAIYNPLEKKRLAEKLVEFRPDIVHIHNFFPQLSPAIIDACCEANVPVVVTLHNFRLLCPTSVLYHNSRLVERSLYRSCFWTVRQRVYKNSYIGTFFLACQVEFHKWAGTWREKVDRFIALTEFAKGKFTEGGIPADRITVKGNSINPPPPAESSNNKRWGALFVGRLSEEKGLATLLGAWKSIEYPLRLAGDGPLRRLCEIEQSSHLTCLGRLSSGEIYSEMARAAFLVLPSVCYEMFPVTLVEAFAASLPVITTRLGGLSELVEDGRTGLLFNPADPRDLREKVLWAIAHPDEMAEMGRNARIEYECKHTSDLNYTNLMNIYKEVIELRHLRS